MADRPETRPVLIPPLSKRAEPLKVVRERPKARRREVEHPHCEEHFLFTPHCAACLEAERTQRATARAVAVEGTAKQISKAKPKPPQSSRSFGFKDQFPLSLAEGPTLLNRLQRYGMASPDMDAANDLVNFLSDI